MSIINQNLDASEKKRWMTLNLGAMATGVSTPLALLPQNASLKGLAIAALGLSGSPIYSLNAYRMSSGGLTSVVVGATITAQSFGTSGSIGPFGASGIAGVSLFAGITLLSGDLLVLLSGGANTASASLVVALAVEALDDIRKYVNTVV